MSSGDGNRRQRVTFKNISAKAIPKRLDRSVKNISALDYTRRLDKSWQPPAPQPFVTDRDPYKNIARTPENNFNEVGGRKGSDDE